MNDVHSISIVEIILQEKKSILSLNLRTWKWMSKFSNIYGNFEDTFAYNQRLCSTEVVWK